MIMFLIIGIIGVNPRTLSTIIYIYIITVLGSTGPCAQGGGVGLDQIPPIGSVKLQVFRVAFEKLYLHSEI